MWHAMNHRSSDAGTIRPQTVRLSLSRIGFQIGGRISRAPDWPCPQSSASLPPVNNTETANV